MKINYTPQNMPKKPVFDGKLERDIEKEAFLSSFLERELRKGEYISKRNEGYARRKEKEG